MAERRAGKPYIWVTWLADILGGDDQCKWKVWFKAHHTYEKVSDPDSSSLQRWRRNHDALVEARVQHVDKEGWSIWRENETEFKLEGESAVIAGKTDFAIKSITTGTVVIGDGKTGAPKSSHWWQVLLYMYALPRARKDLEIDQAKVFGEIFYSDAPKISIPISELNERRRAEIFHLIKAVGGEDEPRRVPSFSECRKCNISKTDCPERVEAAIVAKTEDF
jgi:CRISPR/Cas system-associated exonuclease Cas4 (RecB family)